MYANVLSGVRQGVMTKHVTPRFPATVDEVTRLLGFTPSFSRVFGCQESSGGLVSLGGGLTLAASAAIPGIAASVYRKPVTGIQEVGARTPSTGVHHFRGADTGVITAGSFLVMYYGALTLTAPGSNPNVGFGFLDEADGSQFALIGPTDGSEAQWVARCRDDASNSKTLAVAGPTPVDGVARATALLYDATTGVLHVVTSGRPAVTSAMGAWVGWGAGTASPAVYMGGWPGVSGSDLTSRYGIFAHGAQLDNQGVNLEAIVRRLGWQ